MSCLRDTYGLFQRKRAPQLAECLAVGKLSTTQLILGDSGRARHALYWLSLASTR
jgi:hypothetical protein